MVGSCQRIFPQMPIITKVVLPVCRVPKRAVTGDSFRQRKIWRVILGRGILCCISSYYMMINNVTSEFPGSPGRDIVIQKAAPKLALPSMFVRFDLLLNFYAAIDGRNRHSISCRRA
jgi:hypothetical protein